MKVRVHSSPHSPGKWPPIRFPDMEWLAISLTMQIIDERKFSHIFGLMTTSKWWTHELPKCCMPIISLGFDCVFLTSEFRAIQTVCIDIALAMVVFFLYIA